MKLSLNQAHFLRIANDRRWHKERGTQIPGRTGGRGRSAIMRSLEKAGLVRREFMKPYITMDRSEQYYKITEEGRKAIEEFDKELGEN